ncbi:hypothetical protein Hdeb2414_s0041g00737041 [Helianthus debilis subsp. tardiflorus]
MPEFECFMKPRKTTKTAILAVFQECKCINLLKTTYFGTFYII